jgi:hypothetical protein
MQKYLHNFQIKQSWLKPLRLLHFAESQGDTLRERSVRNDKRIVNFALPLI